MPVFACARAEEWYGGWYARVICKRIGGGGVEGDCQRSGPTWPDPLLPHLKRETYHTEKSSTNTLPDWACRRKKWLVYIHLAEAGPEESHNYAEDHDKRPLVQWPMTAVDLFEQLLCPRWGYSKSQIILQWWKCIYCNSRLTWICCWRITQPRPTSLCLKYDVTIRLAWDQNTVRKS